MTDGLWLFFLAVCLSAGVIGGSYLKKDELLPICHSLAPGLFPPVSVTLATNTGVFDSELMFSGQPYQVTFIGSSCDVACEQHVAIARAHASAAKLPHLWVVAGEWVGQSDDKISRGQGLGAIQAAQSFGLSESTWSMPGYAASWVLNSDHHIESRHVLSQTPWAD